MRNMNAGIGRSLATALAVGALVSAQAAAAQDTFYQGECARAYDVQAANSIDRIFTYSSYRGVSMHRFEDQSSLACKTDQVIIRYLTRSSVTKDAARYNVSRKTVKVGSKPDGCAELSIWNETVIGTVTFTMEMTQSGDFCTLNLWADWNLTDTNDSAWRGAFKAKMLMLNEGSFVASQPNPGGGRFNSPLAFTGLK